MPRYLWLAVETDKYELPLAVADTAQELGAIYGIKKDTVIDMVSKGKSGKISGRKFIKVINDA